MSANELFDVPVSLSPKLIWLTKHGVISYRHAPGHGIEPSWFVGFQKWWPGKKGVDFFAKETAHNGDSRVSEGETEDDAILDFCDHYRIKHWSVE